MAEGNGQAIGHTKTQLKKRAFLDAFSVCGNVLLAAKTVEMERCTHYKWLKSDEQYSRDFDEATEDACDILEAEATRRAVKGVQRPVYQGGELVGHTTEYSDVLLIFLLKGRRPEVYRERVEHLGDVHVEHDVVLTVEFDDRTALPKVVQNLLERS